MSGTVNALRRRSASDGVGRLWVALSFLQSSARPERIGLWTVDEFAAMAIPFVVGIMTQHVLLGIGFGFLGWWGLRKAKAGRAASWLVHVAYW